MGADVATIPEVVLVRNLGATTSGFGLRVTQLTDGSGRIGGFHQGLN